MLWFLFFLFTILLLESAVFSWVGNILGLWTALGGVIATAITGIVLIRKQGLVYALRLRDKLQAEQFPARELWGGICLCIGGVALIIPGFVSDSLGLLLLIEPFRRRISTKAFQWLNRKATFGQQQHFDSVPIIEGEFYEIQNSKLAQTSEKRHDD